MGKDIQLSGSQLLGIKLPQRKDDHLAPLKRKQHPVAHTNKIARIIEWKKQQERKPEGKAAGRSWPHCRHYLKLIQF